MNLPVYRYDQGTKTIIEHVKVTPSDLITKGLNSLSWFKHIRTEQIYATQFGKRVYLQNVIKGSKGPWLHRDGNPLNYQNHNLVEVPKGTRNIKHSTEQTTNTFGICYVKSRDRYRVLFQGKFIGYFKTLEDAQAARLKVLTSKYPMVQFVPEGTNPDGPSGMQNVRTTEGGRPDVYVDPDDAESLPNLEPVSYGTVIIKDLDYWKAIPPPPQPK